MEKIAESLLLDETALLSLEENLSGLESRRQCLQGKLATVERLISDAVAEQTRLRSSIATHKSLLAYSPVRALPGEVLSEIFLYYIALSQTAQENVFKEIVASHRIHTPILQVCRRWRTTVLADPRLWTTIPLIGSGDRSKSYAHPLMSVSPEERDAYWKALQSRIERTSVLPLHLLFHFTTYGDIGDPLYTISSLQTFISLFPRAHSVSLKISHPPTGIPEFVSIMENADIPHADGVHTARVDVGDAAFGRRVLSAIPNVEVLETRAVNIDQWFIDAPTAGYRLHSLHLLDHWAAIPLVQVLDLLDRAPLLETLKLAGVSIPPSIGTLRVVTHESLSTFHLACAMAEDNDVVFGHITLPALRSLSYMGEQHYHAWPRSSHMAFFQRSGCMLSDLTFRRCHVDDERLIEIRTSQKALVTLQLNLLGDEYAGKNTAIPMPILEFLSKKPKGGSDHPLPALTCLTVVILPRQLKAVKRLVQFRSEGQAKKSRIVALREFGIKVQTKQLGDKIQKYEHAALFKDFVDNGSIGIRISYE
ncbi:hypothetical protein CPB85DRAFT_1563239 [Mucidula mucida]|nr:hypothetical protein CPB85DRAFT_1563239 [Mucidula mucida]